MRKSVAASDVTLPKEYNIANVDNLKPRAKVTQANTEMKRPRPKLEKNSKVL